MLAHGKPQPTYYVVGHLLVLLSFSARADGARRLECPNNLPTLDALSSAVNVSLRARRLECPKEPTQEALRSAISMQRWGPRLERPKLPALSSTIRMSRRSPAAGKPQSTYVGHPKLYIQTGHGGWNAPSYPHRTPPLALTINIRTWGPTTRMPQSS